MAKKKAQFILATPTAADVLDMYRRITGKEPTDAEKKAVQKKFEGKTR